MGVKSFKLNISNKNLLFEKLGNLKIDYIINLAGHINHYEKKKLLIHISKGVKI